VPFTLLLAALSLARRPPLLPVEAAPLRAIARSPPPADPVRGDDEPLDADPPLDPERGVACCPLLADEPLADEPCEGALCDDEELCD
jgi:hypothetical protein